MAMTGTTLAAYNTNLKQFKVEAAQAVAGYKNYGRAKMTTELGTITTALGTDITTHDKTMQSAPAPLRIGNDKSPFTNKVLWAINKGKGANLTTADMATALGTALAAVVKPVNTSPPVVSGLGSIGQNLSSTTGIWSGSPSSYTYAWQRAGVPIAGATLDQYALVGADSGKAIGCIVTAVNSAGSTASPISNTILCA